MARIAIVGPGAIGSVMAAWLAQIRTHEVVVCARRTLTELVVETPEATITAHPKVFTTTEAVPPVDWVLVATKTYDSASASAWLKPLCAQGAAVAILQNGVEQRSMFVPYLRPEQILPVLVYCPAERSTPTHVRQRRKAELVAPDDELGNRFARLFDGTRVAITLTNDFQTAAWKKLCVNAVGAINALLLQPAGIFNDEGIANLARSLMRECIAVGRAERAVLDDSYIEQVLQLYLNNPADSINSLHADRLAGRPMEVDSRNGVIVRLGRKHGIATPCNEMAVALLTAISG